MKFKQAYKEDKKKQKQKWDAYLAKHPDFTGGELDSEVKKLVRNGIPADLRGRVRKL